MHPKVKWQRAQLLRIVYLLNLYPKRQNREMYYLELARKAQGDF